MSGTGVAVATVMRMAAEVACSAAKHRRAGNLGRSIVGGVENGVGDGSCGVGGGEGCVVDDGVAIGAAVSCSGGGVIGGRVRVVVIVEMGAMAGAGHVQDDVLGFVGGGVGLGGVGVAGLALHHRDAIEEELRDVGHGDGVLAGDAVVGDLFEEVAEEEVDAGGGGEIFGAG